MSKSIFDPVVIDTQRLKIRPMAATTWEKLAEGILYEGSFHSRMWGTKTPEDVKKMYDNSIKAFEMKRGNPLVFLSPDEKEVYGTTNFMNIEVINKMTEIGGTWISKKWQRTFVNTETKFELLKYCFESLQYHRVEFRVDIDNLVSQKAVERLGIVYEGLARRRKINANGDVRDYKFYAVTDLDWPSVKEHILKLTKLTLDVGSPEINP